MVNNEQWLWKVHRSHCGQARARIQSVMYVSGTLQISRVIPTSVSTRIRMNNWISAVCQQRWCQIKNSVLDFRVCFTSSSNPKVFCLVNSAVDEITTNQQTYILRCRTTGKSMHLHVTAPYRNLATLSVLVLNLRTCWRWSLTGRSNDCPTLRTKENK